MEKTARATAAAAPSLIPNAVSCSASFLTAAGRGMDGNAPAAKAGSSSSSSTTGGMATGFIRTGSAT
jgi:hypothetical protein